MPPPPLPHRPPFWTLLQGSIGTAVHRRRRGDAPWTPTRPDHRGKKCNLPSGNIWSGHFLAQHFGVPSRPSPLSNTPPPPPTHQIPEWEKVKFTLRVSSQGAVQEALFPSFSVPLPSLLHEGEGGWSPPHASLICCGKPCVPTHSSLVRRRPLWHGVCWHITPFHFGAPGHITLVGIRSNDLVWGCTRRQTTA